MNNTYKSQIATLEDDNAENEKMPQNSKIWIPPAKVRFLEKKVISGVEACGQYFSILITWIECTCSIEYKYVHNTRNYIFIAQPLARGKSQENLPIKQKKFNVQWSSRA
jgi:hypothetical protein